MKPILLLMLAGALAAADPGPTTVDITVDALGGSPAALAVLRSSAFFVPKTQSGYDSYLAMPGGHHATRIGLFEQALADSRDEGSFIANLERHREPLARLCRSTARLVIVIARMPPWLSRLPHATEPVGDAGWRRLHAQPPRDPAAWDRIVAAGVRWFAGFPGPRRDYEVWNEPDLFSWQASVADYLAFYEATAHSVRRADPQAQIGGAALNGWGGAIPGDAGGDLNRQLIRLAGERRVPLDFVSWHWFSADPGDISAAAADYQAASLAAGLRPVPRLQVSEWNAPAELRGTPWTAALHAEAFMRFLEAGVDAQMVAAWEDFQPRPAGLGDYGLVTQQGLRKQVWQVHAWFDALARDPVGWTSTRSGTLRLVAARRQGGCRLLCWDPSPEPRSAAFAVLRKAMSMDELAAAYGNAAALLDWVARGRSKDGLQDRVFAEARAAQTAATAEVGRSRTYRLRLGGLPPGARFTSEAVREVVRVVPLATTATEVRFDLVRNEVMHLDVAW